MLGITYALWKFYLLEKTSRKTFFNLAGKIPLSSNANQPMCTELRDRLWIYVMIKRKLWLGLHIIGDLKVRGPGIEADNI